MKCIEVYIGFVLEFVIFFIKWKAHTTEADVPCQIILSKVPIWLIYFGVNCK